MQEKLRQEMEEKKALEREAVTFSLPKDPFLGEYDPSSKYFYTITIELHGGIEEANAIAKGAFAVKGVQDAKVRRLVKEAF